MDIFTGELLRCLKTAKACADNDHLRRFPCGRLHSMNCRASDLFAPASLFPALTQTPYNKAFVIAPARINFHAVCQNPLHAAKREKQWRNASRLLPVARF